MATQAAHQKPSESIVLIIATGHYETLERTLLTNGYTVVAPATSDQAVSVCLHNRIDAVSIDEEMLAEVEDWSLPRSFKAVSPSTPVLLLAQDPGDHADLPPGVDCVVSASDPTQVLKALQDCGAQTVRNR